MGTVLTIFAVLFVVGVVWAKSAPSYLDPFGWPAWQPNPGGLLLAGLSLLVLSAIGLMKLGAWLW